jgi:hypothetical protein
MLPIRNYVLQLEMVAEYWSREIAGVRTMPEILDELLAAFWHNKITVFDSRGEARVDRRRLLLSIRSKSEHPGFTLADSVQMIPPSIDKYPDGSATVDIMKYIVLPSDESSWTDDIVEAAYRTLATMSFEDFHDLLKPGLRLLGTTQEALATYCDSMGYNLPGFWFRATKGNRVSFGGRPSVMRQIGAEMTRRADRHVLAPTLREEATALLDWAKTHIDEKIQLPQLRSAENALRDSYNKLQPTAVVGEHKT